MTKYEFLEKLSRELSAMPRQDRERSLAYYSERSDADFVRSHCWAGIYLECVTHAPEISFTYRNAFVKNCVGKAGEILETKILQIAYDMRDKKGRPYCSDADRGVFIDWAGILPDAEERGHDTENEIDVMMMHDLTPVFISCKNGAFDDEELYKLFTVSSRFGGSYVKRILVCTDFNERSERYPHLAQRAKDMGISIIPGVQNLSDVEIQAKLKDAISRV